MKSRNYNSLIICIIRYCLKFKFLLIILFFFTVNEVKSQNRQITIESNKITIRQAFDRIEAQSSYTIAYNRTKFDVNKEMSLVVRNIDIEEVLSLILKATGWTYSIKDNHIVIIKEKDDPAIKITQKIRGRVYDKLTGLPLPFASVMVTNDPAKGVLSDDEGYFEINGLPIGRYDVKVSFLGYEPFIYREIILHSKKELFVEIYLTENLFRLSEIVVKSHNNKEQTINPMVLAGGRMFNMEEASRYAGGFDDPARLVTSFAGVSGGIGDNSVIIHGNAPHLLQWRLEGIEIGNPNHFADLTTMGGGIFSSLSSHVLGNSDFLTGAYPAEYSNAFSGIFDMRLRNGNNQYHESSVQASLIGLDIASEGPLKKGKQGSYLFNYRNATFAFIKKYIPDMEINNFGYQDLSFKFHFPYNDKSSFSIWGLALMDKSYEKIERYPTEWSSGTSKLDISGDQAMASGGLTHNYFFDGKTSLKTMLGIVYTNNDFSSDTIQYMDIPNLNLKNRSYNVNVTTHLNHKVSSKHTNKSGIVWTSMFYNFYYDGIDWNAFETIQEKINGHTGSLSVFSNSLIQINDCIRLNLGVNGQMFMLNNNRTIEPRLAVDYSLTNKHSLAFSYGLHNRMERLSTYFIEQNDELINRDLDFIKTHQFVLSYKWKISDTELLKIEPYFHYLYNIPMVSGRPYSTLNGLSFIIDVPLSNEGKGINRGVDLTLERYLSEGFYYLLTGSVFDSKYCDKESNWFNTRYNYRFLMNVLGGKEWIFGSQNQHVFGSNIKCTFRGGERYTPVNEEESLELGKLILYEDKMYENQFSPKLKIDFTLNYKLNKRSMTHEIAFKVLNLTGIREYYRHRFELETQKIVKDEVKIVLPNLSYKISF